MCAVCTISKLRKVRHISMSQMKMCYINRRLRCALPGHNSIECWLQNVGTNERGSCYMCKMSLHQNQRIHGEKEMENRRCKLINGLRVLFLAWTETGLCSELVAMFPELCRIDPHSDFLLRLRKTVKDYGLNYATVLATFFGMFY